MPLNMKTVLSHNYALNHETDRKYCAASFICKEQSETKKLNNFGSSLLKVAPILSAGIRLLIYLIYIVIYSRINK